MNRRLRHSLAIAAVLAATAVTLAGQGQQDLSAVQIKTTKLADNFYSVEGSGGTIGALVGPDGIFMVDAQFAPLTDKIVAALKQISDRPIRFLVNTHVHGDHTGGDENFAKLGVTLLSRDELRTRLAVPGRGGPPPAAALPMITYKGPVTFHMNGEDIQLIPVPVAHTDGDTMVFFPKANVLMTGDFYRSLGYPNIDRANGGSLKGMLDGLAAIGTLTNATTKIVPGHGDVVNKTAVAAHRDMIVAIRDRVAKMVQAGQTQEQVVAAKPTADYDAKVPGVGTTADRFVTQLFQEIKGS
jgi:glyoxylase-like metal-dependent hydrolase (beta-lactamase superfamily II)